MAAVGDDPPAIVQGALTLGTVIGEARGARGAPLVEDGAAGHVDLSRLRAVAREMTPNSHGPVLLRTGGAMPHQQETDDPEAATDEAETAETVPIRGHDLQVTAARHPALGLARAQAHDRGLVLDEVQVGSEPSFTVAMRQIFKLQPLAIPLWVWFELKLTIEV